jgi:hypothetical protein
MTRAENRRRQERWLADTREVCARFLRHVDIAARGSVGADPAVRTASDLFAEVSEAMQAVAELQLLAPDLASPATALSEAMLALIPKGATPREGPDEAEAPLVNAYQRASVAFIAAARRHLTGERVG